MFHVKRAARTATQWRAFQARADARAAAWAAGIGGGGTARDRLRRQRPELFEPLTAAEQARDSLGNYELALAEIRRRS